jgi:hypothetical protein
LFENALTLVIVSLGFILVVVSIALPKLAKNRHGDPVESGRPKGTENELRALERVEDSTLELEETARDVFGRIDTRARMLIQLIEEAEVRSNRIEELLRQTREGQ